MRALLSSVLLLLACAHVPTEPASPYGVYFSDLPQLVPVVSGPYNEIRLATSPDGTMRAWGSTDRPGGPGGWNIWLTILSEGKWSDPIAASFDSESNDFDPAFSADGKWLYFFSNRPGGFGGDDIYRVPVNGHAFGEVEHLGPEVNTAGDEWAPSPSPDGKYLMFASNHPGAKHDLYWARATATGFEKAFVLPGAVNTGANDEFDATFLSDGKTIVFSRSPDVENDHITLMSASPGADGRYGTPEPLVAPVNLPGGDALGPSIDLHEPGVFYFSSKRTDVSAGKIDIYAIHYEVTAHAELATTH